jgi:hypothetical protein
MRKDAKFKQGLLNQKMNHVSANSWSIQPAAELSNCFDAAMSMKNLTSNVFTYAALYSRNFFLRCRDTPTFYFDEQLPSTSCREHRREVAEQHFQFACACFEYFLKICSCLGSPEILLENFNLVIIEKTAMDLN